MNNITIQKTKEPVKIRRKQLKNGDISLYLDIYKDGKREYEFLKLYLIPEITQAAKIQNKNTLKAAEAIKAQRILDIINNRASIKSNSKSKVLLSDWLEEYHERKLKENKIGVANNVRSIQRIIKKYNDKIKLCDIDVKFCKGFIDYLKNFKVTVGNGEKNLTNGTIRTYYKLFSSALNYAVKSDILEVNPIQKVDSDDNIKVRESTRCYLTKDEIISLMKTNCKNENVKRAFLFSCFSGLRISDILKLSWCNVIENNGITTVQITMKKTKNPICIPLSKQALAWLGKNENGKKESKVFILPSYSVINDDVKRWAQRANINKNVTFHVARHTFATLELSLGANIEVVSKLLGHSDIKTTQIYAKIVDKVKVAAVNLTDNINWE